MTVNVIKRSLESDSHLTARQIKEAKSEVFGERKRRVNFVNKYSVWTEEQRVQLLWLDEATFSMTCNRNSQVYLHASSYPLESRPTVPGKKCETS